MKKKALGRTVITVTRKNMQFEEYLYLACYMALNGNALLNTEKIMHDAICIQLIQKSNNIVSAYIYFNTPKLIIIEINSCHDGVRIISDEEKQA